MINSGLLLLQMLPLSLLGAAAVLLASASARPQTGAVWPGSDDGQAPSGSVASGAFSGRFVAPRPETGGFRPLTPRQGRRIAAGTVTNQLAATTTTAKSKTEKKLVTLRPIGNNIQEILFNNNYRETPGESEPEPNNIDDYSQLDGLHPSEVWLLDDDLLVLNGGQLTDGFIDTSPIDNYEAPYRQPKFPPPGFNPDGDLSPDTFGTAFPRGQGQGQRQPEAFIPEFGYNPYGAGRVGRLGQTAPEPRRLPPPAGFQFPEVGHVARRTHQQAPFRSQLSGHQPARLIHNLDGLPKSFSTSNSYPAASVVSGRQQQRAFSAPASTAYDGNGSYMTYTNHDGGYSYSYKTDGKAR